MDEIRRARLEKLERKKEPSRGPSKARAQPNIQPVPAAPAPTPTSVHQPATPSPAPSTASSKSWPQQMLERIFDFSLENGSGLLLEDIASEQRELSFDDVDAIMWEALSKVPQKFEYLSACYERLRQAIRTQKTKQPLVAIETALCSYAVVCGTSDPSELCHANFAQWLATSTIDWQFANMVINTALEQELLDELIDPVWHQFKTSLLSKGLGGDYTKILDATDALLSIKQVAAKVASGPSFAVPKEATPLDIVQKTWLGPYFALSPLDGSFPLTTFSGVDDLSFQNPIAVQRIENTMPETQLIMDRLFGLCDKLVRAGPDARQSVLDYFVAVLNKNHKRMASFHVSPKDVNADGFMANMAWIAVKFCLPFLDFSGSKLAKIDPNYFLYSNSYDISEETKLVADLEESKQTLADKSDTPPNFITQIFFITVGFLHYGVAGLFQSETRFKRARQHVVSQVDQIEAAVARMGDTPYAQNALQRAKTQRALVESTHLALSGVIRNEHLMTTFYDFSAFVQFWTLHQAQPSFPSTSLQFDHGQASPTFRSYPEHLVESYVATMSFIGQALPQIARNSTSPIVQGLIFYMECPQFIKNPYLKSQMVDVLFYGSISQTTGGFSRQEIPGYFVDVFDGDTLCQQYLFHALMKIYVDMELTGRSAQFYEKFHTREVISRIMKVLWKNPVYQQRLEQESVQNEDFFVKFTALLLNDSTYMLDEALSKLQDIHRLQQEIEANPNPDREQQQQQQQQGEGRDEDDDANATPQQQLSTAEDRAKQYLELARGCIDLLSTFTSKIPGPFIRAEVVDRFVSMLNYNLNALVGTKCSELKVKTPEKYGFNPRQLLTTIVRIYLNLSGFDDFVSAVARDSESFGVEIFARAQGILSKHTLMSVQEQNSWHSFLQRVDVAIQENEDDEEELGEIPDEFLDPLMYTIMKDPVILPSSRTTIDLTTIKSYLLNTPTDPFNRSPLNIEDVIPNTDLKMKIEEFKRNAKSAK